MNKKTKTIIALSILILSSFSILAPTISYAQSPAAYVPITLTNNQGSPTVDNFQQLIKVNWSKYASYLNSNVSNVRFYSSSSFSSTSELYAWIETNNSTSAVSSNVWVNLSSVIIPASGSTTIYMAFLSKSSSWSEHWGLAPQLSTKYGQFDNGFYVFKFYCDFAGTTLNSEWTNPTGSSYSVNNGFIGTPSGGSTCAIRDPSIQETSSIIVNWGINLSSTSYPDACTNFQLNRYTTNSNMHFLGVRGDDTLEQDGRTDVTTSIPIPSTGVHNFGIWNDGTTVIYYYPGGSYTDTSATAVTDYLALSWSYNGQSNNAPTIYYVYVRYYPPNGAMPSSTFGSVSVQTGYHVSFYENSLPTATIWGIRLNNTTSVIWLNSSDNYDNFTGLPNGEYTFQVINATGYGSSPYSGVIDIDGKNITKNITFTGYTIQASETGLPQGDTWNLNVSDQSGLSESSKGQHLSSDTTSISFTLPNGTYTYSYQTSDHRYQGGTGTLKVSGSSYSFTVVFNPVLYYLNFTALDKPNFLEWAVNLSGTIKSGYGNISFQLVNGTYYWNASAINGTFQNPIGYYRLTNGSGLILLHNESSFKGVRVVIDGKNYNDNISFARAYNITFEEVGISNNFQWDVNLSNGLGSILEKHIIVSDNTTQVFFNSTEGNYINGTYSGSIQLTIYGLTGIRYINLTASSSLSLTVNGGNIVFAYYFTTQYYLTTISEPAGGGYRSPYSGWFNASSSIQLTAQSNSSFEFTGFQGSNTSSYTGMGYYSSGQYIASITMTNPITEVMDFNNYIVLTFYMQNITSGISWGVKLTEQGSIVQWNNGTGDYIVFDIAEGIYSYQITGVKSTPQSDQISITSSTEVLLQYDITTYDVNFKEIGLQPGTNWNVEIFSNIFSYTSSGASSILNFEIPNGTYSYTAGSVYGYISNDSSGSFTVSESAILIYVNWTQGNPLILEGIRHFVPIYLNTSDYSIAAGTQIPINVNWNKYSAFENYNLSNVIFMNSTFYPLYSWIENNASSSFDNSTVWVKITSEISYNSSMTIYLAWQSKNRNNFNKFGYLGEASQLSQIYGEYDNIALVMNKGLLTQIYVNTTSLTSDIAALPLLNAAYIKGTKILDGEYFTATSDPFLTPFQGSTKEVYADSPGGYSPYALENNVLISYQLYEGDTGTWPAPPLTDSTQSFLAKTQGFVIMNQQLTDWYELDDDGRYLEISNGTPGSYLSNDWTSGSALFNFLGSSGSITSLSSASTDKQGDYRISFLYNQYNAEALWQFWTNYRVSYYSPDYSQYLGAMVKNITFGSPASSYNAFYEYGLPVNTNWTIAISGPGITKLYTSDSNLIYTYLPNGTYLYTVGSFINGSYHSGIDGKFIPSPSSGHVIVTGAFTVQYIIFSLNQVLKYDLTPEQASGQGNNITLPILVINIQGLPAGLSTIDNVIKYLNASLIAKNENQTTVLRFTISQAKEGMIVIFLNISQAQIDQVKNGSAVVSFVSGFQLGTIEEVAAGVAGSEIFSSVSGSSPVVNNTKTNTNTINQIISYLAYLESQDYGRALYLVLVLLAIMFYVLSISKHLKKKKNVKA